jgi:hypothetical protein
MTSSARARIEGGTVRPSALAVLRLTTSSNLVGCYTGRSAGFSPLLYQIQKTLHERTRFAPIFDYFWPSGIGRASRRPR